MSGDLEIAVTATTRAAVDSMSEQLSAIGGDETEVLERRGLGGGAPEWIVVGGIAATSLRHFLNFMLDWKGLDRVRLLTVGDVSIENPRPQDVDRLMEQIESTSGSSD